MVVNRLTESIRSVDTAARQGGDEFLVIIQGAESIAAATTLADKLVKAIAQPIDYHGHRVNIGSSIGVALYPEHARDPDELLRCSDGAMYAVKKAGKNAHTLYRKAEANAG